MMDTPSCSSGSSIANGGGQSYQEDSRKLPRLHAEINERGPLSVSEAKVIGYLAEGMSQKQIARKVNRSIKTIQTQLDAAYRKLEATGATHAIGIAITKGIVSLTLLSVVVMIFFGPIKEVPNQRMPPRTAWRQISARTTRWEQAC